MTTAVGSAPHTAGVNDERPPICPACGVTMVPAALSAREAPAGDWICLECEETSESEPFISDSREHVSDWETPTV
jgi:hypothetical protein